MTDRETRTLDIPGGALHYDIHGDPHRQQEHPPLFLIGSPMDAGGFATLVTHFTDRPVVTYDPRGVGRSVRTDGIPESTPEEHAADLHRVIAALDAGPVDLFGTSGGAVNGLAMVATYPDQVRTFVAHEPPAAQVLPDREQMLAACWDVYRTYQRSGSGPAMAKFMALTAPRGPLPENYADEPAPNPTDVGLPTEDDGSRGDPLLGKTPSACTGYQPDFAALAAASTRIVVAAGRESEGTMMARAAAAIAARLGLEVTAFPSHHIGFTGEEFGMKGDPVGFAKTLHEVLD